MSLILYVYYNGHCLVHYNHKWPDWWMDAHVNWKYIGEFRVSIPGSVASVSVEWIDAPGSTRYGDPWLGFGNEVDWGSSKDA